MSNIVKRTVIKAKPVMSTSMPEAQRRVKNLYKAWFRAIPTILTMYDIPQSPQDCKDTLRENFMRNRDLRDVRAVDLLVIKGHMELQETLKFHKQAGNMLTFFKPTIAEKPKDFLSKFLDGH